MKFTVFTPTYNRKHLLHRVTESLAAQTISDFEWILVDDGSTDGTAEWARQFAAAAPFPVRVLIQPANAGKHAAWNRAVQAAAGELFVIADSDDAFVPESLERLDAIWRSIPDSQRESFSGVSVLCQDAESGQVCGDPFPSSPLDTNELELRYVRKLTGERWGAVRTELLRQIPFPSARGSHFAEDYVWLTLARSYRIRCVNEPLRIFHDDRRSDRLTRERKVSIPAPRYEAGYVWNTLHLSQNLDYLWRSPRELLITAANAGRSGRILGRAFRQTLADVRHPIARLLCFVLYPLALYLYERDRLQGRFTPSA